MKIGKDYASIIEQELAVDNWNAVHDNMINMETSLGNIMERY